MKTIGKVLLYIWQLSQNILGLLFMALFYTPWKKSATTIPFRGSLIVYFRFSEKMEGGLTLGEYIFIKGEERYNPALYNTSTIRHEFGHVRQSRILGPLYILVIGIRSLIHAGIHSGICKEENYHHYWTEKWADKLAGLR